MATDFIDQLRKATFPLERRGGYDPKAVSAYLNELADWLETGGGDQARAMLVQREMERVGERTGTILSTAQQSADRITSDAQADADRVRKEADTYSTETRAAADEHAKSVSEAAESDAAEERRQADEQAKATIREAEARLQRATEEAAERTRGVEDEIAALVRRRDQANDALERVISGLRKAIDGPGSEDLGLPERVEAAAGRRPDPPDPAESSVGPPPVQKAAPVPAEAVAEHQAVDATEAGTEVLQLDTEEAEPPAAPEAPETEPTAEAPASDEYPLFEEEGMDDAERERRRRSIHDQGDEPTDERNVADLL